MPTFAQKQNQPEQKSSATRNTLAPAASYEAQQILHLQHTIGNQAALMLLRARADRVEAASDTEDGSTTEVRSETPTRSRFAYDFSRIPVHAPAAITIQPKLAVNTPGDVYEQEADHVAEQVMRMPEPKLQRACACGGGCASCQTKPSSHEHQRLQTKHVGSSETGQTAAPPIVHEILRSPGQPLDAATRAFMEPRFGHDFSMVRLHSDSEAEKATQPLGALAYTVGSHIVVGEGQHPPNSAAGRQLLAHELAHVLQQRSGVTGGTNGGAAAKREADRVAFAVGAGGPVPDIREQAPGGLQCKSEAGVNLAAPSADPQDPTTSRIADAYGSGSLDEQQWKTHVNTARHAVDGNVKQREYELLFRDVARLAGASAVLGDDKINWLAGAKPVDNKSYKPGLNLTPFGSSDLGAAGFTGFVNAKGEIFQDAPPLEPGGPSVQIAIVMTVDDFDSGKEYALAVLRHEMMHAVHAREALLALVEFQADMKKGAAKSKKDLPRVQFHKWVEQQQNSGRYSPVDAAVIEELAQTARTAGSPNSELLAHFEGFMTRFHMSKPPIELNDAVFDELGGALEKPNHTLPWRSADPAVRAEVLGRFRKYYLEALDKPHRDAFREWVSFQMTKVQTDRALEGQPSGSLHDRPLGDLDSAIVNKNAREDQMNAHFFRSLQEMLAQIENPATPMALGQKHSR